MTSSSKELENGQDMPHRSGEVPNVDENSDEAVRNFFSIQEVATSSSVPVAGSSLPHSTTDRTTDTSLSSQGSKDIQTVDGWGEHPEQISHMVPENLDAIVPDAEQTMDQDVPSGPSEESPMRRPSATENELPCKQDVETSSPYFTRSKSPKRPLKKQNKENTKKRPQAVDGGGEHPQQKKDIQDISDMAPEIVDATVTNAEQTPVEQPTATENELPRKRNLETTSPHFTRSKSSKRPLKKQNKETAKKTTQAVDGGGEHPQQKNDPQDISDMVPEIVDAAITSSKQTPVQQPTAEENELPCKQNLETTSPHFTRSKSPKRPLEKQNKANTKKMSQAVDGGGNRHHQKKDPQDISSAVPEIVDATVVDAEQTPLQQPTATENELPRKRNLETPSRHFTRSKSPKRPMKKQNKENTKQRPQAVDGGGEHPQQKKDIQDISHVVPEIVDATLVNAEQIPLQQPGATENELPRSEETVSPHVTRSESPKRPSKKKQNKEDTKKMTQTKKTEVESSPLPPPKINQTQGSSWLDDMQGWLLQTKFSPASVRNVMKQVKKLASGEGIGYHHWPDDVVFYKGVCVDIHTADFEQMLADAKQYADTYGKDKGNGWLMRIPINKMKLFSLENSSRGTEDSNSPAREPSTATTEGAKEEKKLKVARSPSINSPTDVGIKMPAAKRQKTIPQQSPAVGSKPSPRRTGPVMMELSTWNKETRQFTVQKRMTSSEILDQSEQLPGGKKGYKIQLPLGGELILYPNFISSGQCQAIESEAVGGSDDSACGVFRQYQIQNGDEPRLHSLLSCNDDDLVNGRMTEEASSYKYHGVQMKAFEHISEYPAMHDLSQQAAVVCGLQGFNIGCDVLAYRNGKDKIGYHADDTQGEQTIFCTVAQCEQIRYLHIVPKGRKKKECADGDYELKIYCSAGDSYSMDGKMQENYVHALPQASTKGKPQARRIALIFRHGDKIKTSIDNGFRAKTMEGKLPLTPEQKYAFGPYRDFVTEGAVYDRTYLLKSRAFSSIQGGVSGSKSYGCNAIVVSRQSMELHEYDFLEEISYSSNGWQGGGSLFQSFCNRYPVRVFRTSSLQSQYGAFRNQKVKKQWYRYDGMYEVYDCQRINESGESETPREAPMGDLLYTFFLRRLPSNGFNLPPDHCNQLSLEDLKHVIEKGEELGETKDLSVLSGTNVPVYKPYVLSHQSPLPVSPRSNSADASLRNIVTPEPALVSVLNIVLKRAADAIKQRVAMDASVETPNENTKAGPPVHYAATPNREAHFPNVTADNAAKAAEESTRRQPSVPLQAETSLRNSARSDPPQVDDTPIAAPTGNPFGHRLPSPPPVYETASAGTLASYSPANPYGHNLPPPMSYGTTQWRADSQIPPNPDVMTPPMHYGTTRWSADSSHLPPNPDAMTPPMHYGTTRCSADSQQISPNPDDIPPPMYYGTPLRSPAEAPAGGSNPGASPSYGPPTTTKRWDSETDRYGAHCFDPGHQSADPRFETGADPLWERCWWQSFR
ncbi:expressed unknown protein [Seminavis robusta]|uniref:YDG domain-containing protein n=1 Tax=Seminavis robusta TaxID=568900 RepID=A0A9N8DCJ8_9STRA|nr:expressed unknown protein [Seminavis robusta]|eukprot:Sro57_g033440.1 n/a (1502) ;mRNA; r:98829-103409